MSGKVEVEEGLMAQAAEAAGVKAYSWEQFLELGKASPAAAVPPKPEDLCTIMYTSGTTGDPKVTHLVTTCTFTCLSGYLPHAWLR